jgi:hypothetical protein
MKLQILVSSLCIMLAACADERTLQISSTPLTTPILAPPQPQPVRMLPVNWQVVTAQNLDAFVRQLQQSQNNQNQVFVAIQMSDYENLALNLADLRRYIEQQQAVIVYYREVTRSQSNN